MTTLRHELRSAGITGPTALTLGVFDGVHLGHRHLINALRSDARELELTSVVLTFANHPLSVLQPGTEIVLLVPLEERVLLLKDAGAECVVPLTFTQEMASLSASDFVGVLQEELGLLHMVVGPDFALGHNREGTIPALVDIGGRQGFTVNAVEPFTLEGKSARSTSIRQALANADVAAAAEVLGRPFSISGPVVSGEGRGGSTLGFPTCNIRVGPAQALPADGVYAAWVVLNHVRHPAAASVGTKPTFHKDGPRVVEAFVLNFDGNLYGSHVAIEFVRFLRAQERFHSADALAQQMALDVENTRAALGSPTQTPDRRSR